MRLVAPILTVLSALGAAFNLGDSVDLDGRPPEAGADGQAEAEQNDGSESAELESPGGLVIEEELIAPDPDPLRILLVDDTEEQRFILCDALHILGYRQTEEVDSGSEAVAIRSIGTPSVSVVPSRGAVIATVGAAFPVIVSVI